MTEKRMFLKGCNASVDIFAVRITEDPGKRIRVVRIPATVEGMKEIAADGKEFVHIPERLAAAAAEKHVKKWLGDLLPGERVGWVPVSAGYDLGPQIRKLERMTVGEFQDMVESEQE